MEGTVVWQSEANCERRESGNSEMQRIVSLLGFETAQGSLPQFREHCADNVLVLTFLQAVHEKTGEKPTHKKFICCGTKYDSITQFGTELEVKKFLGSPLSSFA